MRNGEHKHDLHPRDIGKVFLCRWGVLVLTSFYLEIRGQLCTHCQELLAASQAK